MHSLRRGCYYQSRRADECRGALLMRRRPAVPHFAMGASRVLRQRALTL